MKELREAIEEVQKLHRNFMEVNDKEIEERKKLGESTGETRAMVEKIGEDVTALVKEIDEIRALAAAPRVTKEEEANEAKIFQRKAMDKFFRRGYRPEIFDEPELRALSEASDGDGGFFTPEEMETQIQMNASEIAVIRPLCNTGTTGRQVVVGPLISKPIVAWGAEKLDITEQELGAGQNRLEIFDLKALWLISNDTLEDADADVVGELTGAFGRVIAETEDFAFAAGTGARQPMGVVSNPTVQTRYTATGVADAIADASNNGMDALITALSALKGVYRANATFIFNSTTMGIIMKLKDGEGRYLWQPSNQDGQPSRLLGKRVALAEGMPDVAANAFPIAVGDFQKGYKIRDRRGMTIQRLNERYAEKGMIGFIITKRLGGMVNLPEAFQLVKVATS